MIDIPQQDQHQIDVELELEMIGDVVCNLIRYIDEMKELNNGNDHTKEDLHQLVAFRCQLIYQYINLIISFRLFYIKFYDDNNFKHFKAYFRLNKSVIMIKQDLQMELLETYLIKEMQLASILGIQLERDDEEGVHYEEYVEEELQKETVSSEDDEDAASYDDEKRQRREKQQRLQKAKLEQLKQAKTWQLEKDLSVYTLKLISLMKLQLISNDIYQRLQKNAGKLGEVYYKLIEQEKVVVGGHDDRPSDEQAGNGDASTDLDIDIGDGADNSEAGGNDKSRNGEDEDGDGDKEQDVSMDLQLELVT